MKWFFLVAFGCSYLACFCQDMTESKTCDYISITSRKKADSVLEGFDKVSGIKMLYSVRNAEFYISTKNGNDYEEYYIFEDKPSHFKTIKLKVEKGDRKLLSKAFRLDRYHTEFITSMPHAKFIQGYPSYFVIKDENGKRYGEFSLSYLTIPAPIDKATYAYVTRKLADLSFIYPAVPPNN